MKERYNLNKPSTTIKGKFMTDVKIESEIKKKYNRAFVTKDASNPFIKKILDATAQEDTEYWIIHSKESFHGEHDEKFFYFKDSRIETGTKLPLDCVELESTENDLADQ